MEKGQVPVTNAGGGPSSKAFFEKRRRGAGTHGGPKGQKL